MTRTMPLSRLLPDVALPRIPGMKDILAAGKKPSSVNAASDVEAAVVDVVETRRTLVENGLEIVEDVAACSARLQARPRDARSKCEYGFARAASDACRTR